MSSHTIVWSHGKAEVLSTAAMLAACRFDLGGRTFEPFARAPWMGSGDYPAETGHMRELGGDFVCVPFGGGGPLAEAPADWAAVIHGEANEPGHGPAADAEWTIVEQRPDRLSLALDYPETYPVSRLERSIAGVAGMPGLAMALKIFARRAGSISVGLHPILKLPERPGGLELKADFDFGLLHPAYATRAGGQAFFDLSSVPWDEGRADFSHVPFDQPREANLQLCGMNGPIRALYRDEGAGVALDWDRGILPSLQIWHSDRYLAEAPWSGRYRGIGLEPIAAAFDLYDGVSVGDNPISRRGVATAVQLDPERPVVIDYSITTFATHPHP